MSAQMLSSAAVVAAPAQPAAADSMAALESRTAAAPPPPPAAAAGKCHFLSLRSLVLHFIFSGPLPLNHMRRLELHHLHYFLADVLT